MFIVCLFSLVFISLFLLFFFPYFRGISLNSRAGLEFEEFRLFFQDYSPKKMKFNVVFEKSSWENQNPLGYFKEHIEFHVFFEERSWKKAEIP